MKKNENRRGRIGIIFERSVRCNEINIVLRGIDFVLSVCATHPLGSVRCMLLLKARPDQIGC